MSTRDLLLALLERSGDDFTSYFEGTPTAEVARDLIRAVLANPEKAESERLQIEELLPDTEDDGSVEASYALNAGSIATLLVAFTRTGSHRCVEEAITLFLDSADFRAQEALEAEGVTNPTEAEIQQHPVFTREKEWLGAAIASYAAPH